MPFFLVWDETSLEQNFQQNKVFSIEELSTPYSICHQLALDIQFQ
jgi:hypothetical protein